MFYDSQPRFPIDGGWFVQMVRQAGAAVAKALLAGVLVVLVGWAVSAVCLGTAIWMLFREGAPGFQSDPGFWGWLVGVGRLVASHAWTLVLAVVALGGFVVHAVLGYKYALQELVFRLWGQGQERLLEPLLVAIAEHLERTLPKTVRSAVKWGALRVEMLESLRQDPSVGFAKRLAIAWLLEKIRADKLDLSDGRSLGSSIAAALRVMVAEIVEPSWFFPLVAIGLQGATLGLALWMGL